MTPSEHFDSETCQRALDQAQEAADLAWSEWQNYTNLARVWYERLQAARQHEKRVAAVDDALRKAG